MIINGTHIQGVFKYDNSLEFEKGDFVIESDTIYICTAESPTNSETQVVKGQLPSVSPQNFKVYLGDKITSVTEYLESISSTSGTFSGTDKYISSSTLSGILSHYMFGMDQEGVINKSVVFEGGRYYIYEGENIFTQLIYTGNVLDYLMVYEYLNSAILKLDPNLPELKDGLFAGHTEDCILRQMTYTNSTGERVRIQCLISPATGRMWWRQYIGTTPPVGVAWKSTFYDYTVKDQLDYLQEYYQKKIQEVESYKKTLQNCWRNETVFSGKISYIAYLECYDDTLDSSYGNIYIPVNPGTFKYNPNIFRDKESDSLVLQTIIRRPIGGAFRSYSVALDLREVIASSSGDYIFNVDDGVFITLTIPDPETLPEEQKDSRIVLTTFPENCIIGSMYFRRYYKDE